eukprot:GHVU01162809.1.p1 GENE.GHVU01162809.1~~GHVU01162809.1.p1  ORF type:complete len:273 (-),score=42.03 GHVU01162809.1:3325-4086(-)
MVTQQEAPVYVASQHNQAPIGGTRSTVMAQGFSVQSNLNLPPAEYAIYKRKFDAFDLNKDGIISLREFATVSKVMGYRLDKDEIKEIFNKPELDESAGINFDEFVVAMKSRAQKNAAVASLREKWRIFDTRQRGFITTDEAYPILHRELGFDETKTEALVDLYDKNRDYRLSIKEFMDFIQKVEELKGKLVAVFRDFDTNNDGFVDPQEAQTYMVPRGFQADEVQRLVHKYDRDGDGKLNYHEFARFWDIPIN